MDDGKEKGRADAFLKKSRRFLETVVKAVCGTMSVSDENLN